MLCEQVLIMLTAVNTEYAQKCNEYELVYAVK